ncbi:MAG: ScyD/ScyE family protein [candidate division WOR-3 bacterium]
MASYSSGRVGKSLLCGGEKVGVHEMSRFYVLLLVVFLLTPHPTRSQGSTYPVFASDLQAPTKVVLLPNGLILAAEGGSGNNDGRISIFNNAGERRTLIEGLPSGLIPEPIASPCGPHSIVVRHRTVYISIGIGDLLQPASLAPQEGTGTKVNPTPLSPLFSSVLQIDFESEISFETGPFSLAPADHDTLADGLIVTLTSADGQQRAQIRVLVNFLPDVGPDTTSPPVARYRGSDPLDLVLDSNQPHILYVTDGGLNKVVRIDTTTGEYQDLVRFDKLPKPPGNIFGPAKIDPVPSGMRQAGRWLYVTFLTGFPYAQGAAQIHRIDLTTGTDEVILKDDKLKRKEMTSLVDLEPSGDGGLFVLQLSTNLFVLPPLKPAPGRLLRFDLTAPNPLASVSVVADGLEMPNSMARDPATGEIFVVQIGAGNIIRVSPQ